MEPLTKAAHAHAVSGNPPVDKVAVGARIKAQRIALGMKQISLAEKVGVRAHTVLRYEKGELLPGSEVLGKIAVGPRRTTRSPAPERPTAGRNSLSREQGRWPLSELQRAACEYPLTDIRRRC